MSLLRRLYTRDHLSQVLGTFGILLMCNEVVRLIWGPQPISLNPPEILSGPVQLFPGFSYPIYRLLIIAVGLVVALVLWLLITRTRVGMQVRAGASNRQMAMMMGANVGWLFTGLFGVGAARRAGGGAACGCGRYDGADAHPDPVWRTHGSRRCRQRRSRRGFHIDLRTDGGGS